jgi:hypothetical protein
MTIYWVNNKPYLAVHNGFKEIDRNLACEMYEKGEVTNEIEVNNID